MNKKTQIANRLDLYTLLLANAVTLVLFMVFDGSIMLVLWTYWLQSVIIGFVNFLRITRTNLGKRSNSRVFSIFKSSMALFFAMHYGGFHFVYFVFLAVFSSGSLPLTINGSPAGEVDLSGSGVSIPAILIGGFLFAIHHFRSYKHEIKGIANLGFNFVKPYSRIIPMHIIIIVGPVIMSVTGSANYIFALFIVLKTVVDVILFEKRISHPMPLSAS